MTTSTERPYAARGGLIARYPLVFFFTLTCLLTWGWDMLSWALGLQLLPSTSKYYEVVGFQGMGVAIVFGTAALIVIVFTRGRLGYANYLQDAEEDPDLAMAGTP